MSTARQILRGLRAAPGLAAVIVVSLAIGVGVNAAVFTWIQRVVLEPIPGVRSSGSMLLVEPRTGDGRLPGASWPDYRDLHEGLTTFDGLLAFRMTPVTLGDGPRATRVYGLIVSPNYFEVLGLRPAAGRFFSASPGAAAVPEVVVSESVWQQSLGGDADLSGRTLRMNGRELAVTGVAPRGFQGTVTALDFAVWLSPAAWRTLAPESAEFDDRGSRSLTMLGRLRKGVPQSAAQAQVDQVTAQLAVQHPQTNRDLGAGVLTFWQAPRGPQRMFLGALALLQSVLLVVLLAVCGNASTLLLARASDREHEFAVRLALGATRGRVVRQLLAESLVLALAGAALGALLAVWGSGALRATPALGGFPIRFETAVNGTTLLVVMMVGLAAGLIFGAAPALHLARIGPSLSARVSASRSRPKAGLRDGVLAAQVALALVVLVAAALFLQRFGETLDADPGFRRDGVLLAAYDLSGRGTGDGRVFAARLIDRLRELPVEGVAVARAVPLDIHGLPLRSFAIEGQGRADGGRDQALSNVVTPGYFATMGIGLLDGRDFSPLDRAAGPAEAIVNQAFADRFLAGREPLGVSLSASGQTAVVVGLVQTTTSDAFGEPPTPVIYYSWRDRPSPAGQMHLRVRPGSEAAVTAALRAAFAELDPDAPVYDVRTLSEHVDRNLLLRRIPARLFAVLGPLLFLLAVSGVHAAASRAVTLQTRELGVRLALGASPGRLVTEVVRDRLLVVVVGLAAGWLLTFGLATQLASGPGGWLAYGVVPLVLLAVAGAACWLPARRIAGIDPVTALRAE